MPSVFRIVWSTGTLEPEAADVRTDGVTDSLRNASSIAARVGDRSYPLETDKLADRQSDPMLFPTHLAGAYLVGKRRNLPVYWVVAGAALPDVVDKPLAMGGLFELYHTIGHSLPFLLALSAVILVGDKGVAFWGGWASHLFFDAFHMIVNGRPADVLFLVWPFIRHEPAVQLEPVAFLFYYLGTPSFFVEILIWIAAVYLFVRGTGLSD